MCATKFTLFSIVFYLIEEKHIIFNVYFNVSMNKICVISKKFLKCYLLLFSAIIITFDDII
jgi:hypothetical protein